MTTIPPEEQLSLNINAEDLGTIPYLESENDLILVQEFPERPKESWEGTLAYLAPKAYFENRHVGSRLVLFNEGEKEGEYIITEMTDTLISIKESWHAPQSLKQVTNPCGEINLPVSNAGFEMEQAGVALWEPSIQFVEELPEDDVNLDLELTQSNPSPLEKTSRPPPFRHG